MLALIYSSAVLSFSYAEDDCCAYWLDDFSMLHFAVGHARCFSTLSLRAILQGLIMNNKHFCSRSAYCSLGLYSICIYECPHYLFLAAKKECYRPVLPTARDFTYLSNNADKADIQDFGFLISLMMWFHCEPPVSILAAADAGRRLRSRSSISYSPKSMFPPPFRVYLSGWAHFSAACSNYGHVYE